MEYKDYYKIMGLKRNATQDEIKQAHRALARKYHPDVSKEPNAEAMFAEAGEAYDVLKDPEKRAVYDQIDPNAKPQSFRSSSRRRSNPGQFDTGNGNDFSDFFADLFGQQAAGAHGGWQSGPYNARGQDHHAAMDIDLADVFQETSRSISLQVPELDEHGHQRLITRAINVKIPKGMKDGQQLRLAGQGSPGIGTGSKGDLYIEIHFKPHPLFQIEAFDLQMQLPITPWEAALGAKIKVPTPGGNVDLKIPPGSNSGNKLRLKGRGIPGNPPGDIYITLSVMVPPADTDQAKAMYEEMGKALAFNPRESMGV